MLTASAAFLCASLLSEQGLAQTPTIPDTVRHLQAIQVTDATAAQVPVAARPLLTQLKQQLLDLITHTLNEPGHPTRRPREIRAAVLEYLRRDGVDLKQLAPGAVTAPNSDSDGYGLLKDIRIEQPPGRWDMVAAITTLQIPCGDDSSLYVFEHTKREWRLVLAQEASDYAEISGAQGAFGYALSPAGDAHWFLVTTHFTPGCASMWRSLRLNVLRPGPNANQPRVLWEASQLGRADKPVQIGVDRERFRITFSGAQSLDSAMSVRKHVLEYGISGDHVLRTPPIALGPEDFLDEWLGLSWADASRWVSTSETKALEDWHARLQRANRSYDPEIEFVQPCGDGAAPIRWQIGLSIETEEGAPPLPEKLFFSISSGGKDIYVLTDISTTRPPGCSGETPLQPG